MSRKTAIVGREPYSEAWILESIRDGTPVYDQHKPLAELLKKFDLVSVAVGEMQPVGSSLPAEVEKNLDAIFLVDYLHTGYAGFGSMAEKISKGANWKMLLMHIRFSACERRERTSRPEDSLLFLMTCPGNPNCRG